MFVASLGGVLSACAGGARFLASNGGEPTGVGNWHSLGHPEVLSNCENVALLSLRLPAHRKKSDRITGQIVVSRTEAGGTCEIAPKRGPAMPLAFRIPIDAVTSDQSDRGVVSLTSGSLELLDYPGGIKGPITGASGQATFFASPSFLRQLRQLGFTPTPGQALQLGLSHAGVRDVREITAAFPDANLETVSRFRWFGLAARDAVELKRALPSLSARDLIHFAGFGISANYVEHLRKTEGAALTVEQVRIARLTDLARAQHEQ